MLQQLTPRVYQLDFSQEQDRPVLGYIRGDRFSLMVDAGNSPEHVQAYLAAVEESGFSSAGFCGVDPLSLGSLLRAGIAANAVHCLCADKTVTGNGFPPAVDTGRIGGKLCGKALSLSCVLRGSSCTFPIRRAFGWHCPLWSFPRA